MNQPDSNCVFWLLLFFFFFSFCSPAGSYGDTQGLSEEACQGFCSGGYRCSAGSKSSTALACGGATYYCPPGTGAVANSVSDGYYSTPETGSTDHRTGQSQCLAGFYCVSGVKMQCPAGRYGATAGLTSMLCSASCAPGYFCPIGSSEMTLCGTGKTTPSKWYCPSESSKPVEAGHGYYTVAFDPTTGVEDPSNPVNRRAVQRQCENKMYHCVGDGERKATQTGWYSTGCNSYHKACTSETLCEVGFYCYHGVRKPCNEGEHCPVGSWTNQGIGTNNCLMSAYHCFNNEMKNTSIGYYAIPIDGDPSTPYLEQCRCDQVRVVGSSTPPSQSCGATENQPHAFYCPDNDLTERGTRRVVYDGW